MFHHRCRRHTAPLGVSRVGGTLSVGSMSCLRAQDTTSSGRCAFVACRFSLGCSTARRALNRSFPTVFMVTASFNDRYRLIVAGIQP